MYIYTHLYTHIYIHIYTCTCIHKYIYIYVYASIHVPASMISLSTSTRGRPSSSANFQTKHSQKVSILVISGWRRPIGCLKLQVIFRKRAINDRALWREMIYKDKAFYGSSPPCKQSGEGTFENIYQQFLKSQHYSHCI